MKVSIETVASALEYLVILPNTSQVVRDTFCRWCKECYVPGKIDSVSKTNEPFVGSAKSRTLRWHFQSQALQSRC
jgi:hypothetical protein